MVSAPRRCTPRAAEHAAHQRPPSCSAGAQPPPSRRAAHLEGGGLKLPERGAVERGHVHAARDEAGGRVGGDLRRARGARGRQGLQGSGSAVDAANVLPSRAPSWRPCNARARARAGPPAAARLRRTAAPAAHLLQRALDAVKDVAHDAGAQLHGQRLRERRETVQGWGRRRLVGAAVEGAAMMPGPSSTNQQWLRLGPWWHEYQLGL